MQPNGVVPQYWFPSGGERDFTLGRHLTKLEPFKQNLIVMKGIDNKAGKNTTYANGHIEGVTSFLTGLPPLAIDPANNQFSASGVSIDQLIADHQLSAGYLPKTRSLHFGEEGAGGYSAVAYAGPEQPMAMMSPQASFDLLFEAAADPDAVMKARALKKSVLDGVSGDFTRLSARISGDDKQRIDEHLEALRRIEMRLSAYAACSRPMLDISPENDDETRTLYYDLVAAALTCDATRVVTISFRHSGGGGPQLPFAGVYEDIHELSHQIVAEATPGKAHEDFDKYHQWYTSKTAYLVDRLSNTLLPDGKSLLDETVLLQGSEISWDHDTPDMPYLLLAGAETPFDTGRFVQLAPKVPHNWLLVTLGRAFGLELDEFGDPMYARGHLDQLFKA